MRVSLEQRVRSRAGAACEYCRMPQSAFRFSFPLDHITAKQHGGKRQFNNLALACTKCNLYKGPNLSGIDPLAGRIVPLFHPRRDSWADHFQWRGPRIVGLTPTGRATIRVLNMNNPASVSIRRSLIAEGRFPPRS
jgi:hypothetical protein